MVRMIFSIKSLNMAINCIYIMVVINASIVHSFICNAHSLIDRKEKFWARLSSEVEDSNLNECCTIIQMDGNLWGGPDLIKNDPNSCNNNGKLFKTFLENQPRLTVGTNLDICKGAITRSRKTVNKIENYIIDFFLFCEKFKSFVTEVILDEDKLFVLSNYSKVKRENR